MSIEIVVIAFLLVFFSYLLGYKIGASDCYKYLMKELKRHKNDEDL